MNFKSLEQKAKNLRKKTFLAFIEKGEATGLLFGGWPERLLCPDRGLVRLIIPNDEPIVRLLLSPLRLPPPLPEPL